MIWMFLISTTTSQPGKTETTRQYHQAHSYLSTVKAKMKLADSIYPLLGLPERHQVVTCAQINAKTMDYALSIASQTAIQRMNLKGRSLIFEEDVVYTWGGIAWEYSGGIKWKLNDDDSVELSSAR